MIKQNKELVTENLKNEVSKEVAALFSIKDNMEGVVARLPQIKIIHAGQLFELPDGEKTEKIKGIILDTNRVNAFWGKTFAETGGGSAPDCWSMNGVSPAKECGSNSNIKYCHECDNNLFEEDGHGKKCKNMKRVHILIGNEQLPYRLTLPPSNLKAIDKYLTGVAAKGIPYQCVVTEFSLKKAVSSGFEYSEIACKILEVISDVEFAKKIAKMLTEIKPIMREQQIVASEYEG